MADEKVSASGLTEAEAKEFHAVFRQSFLIFVGIAVVAHVLVWSWRPWLPSVEGYTTSMIDGVQQIVSFLV
ncbi:Light-harvesting LHI, beta subunit [Rhodovastum atsumiense]|uniref:Light-harvesting protein n=1 Tax=Rhodovastum atsumiense TaxID=504468 RepID=A0A5M6IZH4_9PROT|nr:light-harvesting antenna LH1, beta subunit [Rhodovastum atsumiense]KAA5613237.1 light-harvesting protein [Rhodovastum atsumiense]CAH2600606.1 Light-harvesting LHI, beta subunit [Rhodovastum atsumiense]